MAYREKYYLETNYILSEAWDTAEILAEGGVIQYGAETPRGGTSASKH